MPMWVTREFIVACNERDHLYNKFVTNKTEENERAMKCSTNYVTKLTQDLKRDYFRKCLDENKGNSKRLLTTINETFGKTGNK